MKIIAVFLVTLLAAMSVESRELTIYTSRKEHLIKDVFKAYEKETGVKINYKTGKAGALIQSLKAEVSRPKADLLITVDAGNLWYAADNNLFEKINSKKLTKNIPSHLRDPKNRWFGLSLRARTIVANTKNLQATKNISYESLAENKWKNKICLRTSKKVYNQSLASMLIAMNGEDKALDILKGWANNTVDIFPNDTSVLNAVAAGQCEVGIVNTYYFGRLLRKNPKLPLKIVWPNQKSYGVHINVSGAGVVKGSKNKKEAVLFLEWLVSNKAQELFAKLNLEYPVVKSVALADEVERWGSFKANDKFNLIDAGRLQGKSIKLFYKAGLK